MRRWGGTAVWKAVCGVDSISLALSFRTKSGLPWVLSELRFLLEVFKGLSTAQAVETTADCHLPGAFIRAGGPCVSGVTLAWEFIQ